MVWLVEEDLAMPKKRHWKRMAVVLVLVVGTRVVGTENSHSNNSNSSTLTER